MKTQRRRGGPAARVRHLIALDAQNVMSRLDARLEEMVSLFSRLRNRAPLLETVQSWFPGAVFGDLAQLEPQEQRAVSDFYELLGQLRWYLQYTEDMPLQLRRQVDLLAGKLRDSHRVLGAVIGSPESAVVEGEVVEGARGARAIAPVRRRARG